MHSIGPQRSVQEAGPSVVKLACLQQPAVLWHIRIGRTVALPVEMSAEAAKGRAARNSSTGAGSSDQSACGLASEQQQQQRRGCG